MIAANELMEHLRKTTAFKMSLKKAKRKFQRFLKYHPEITNPIKVRRNFKRNDGVKLPKITLKTFSGDPLDWQSFKETFEAAVHNKESIIYIEKFTYLKTYLDKSALQATEGFPLTSENYSEVRNPLNDQYGNEQYIIACHIKKLVKLDPVIHPGVKDLRKLYDAVESHVRSLNGWGIVYQHFGALLITIILEKLPNTIKLQISRKLGKENWNIEQFLLVIHEEVSARDNFEYLKQNNSEKNELNNHSTTSSLHAETKVKKCVFCKNEDHYRVQNCNPCKLEKRNIKLRKTLFQLLKPGHIKKNCNFAIATCSKVEVLSLSSRR